jgi:inosine/xanthosine triphosphate pyrophosphatase family protein
MGLYFSTPKPTKIAFFTHYKQKFDEISKLLGHESIEPVWFPDLPTFEGLDLADLASTRVKLLFDRIKRPCFLEEASLEIEGCNGYPGHCFREIVNNEKYFRKWVMENDGKNATIRLCVGFVDGSGQTRIFEATQKGVIVAPKIESGWHPDVRAIGWDAIFSPDSLPSGKTIADEIEHKHFIDVRLQLYLTFRELINPSAECCYEIHITVALPENLRKTSETPSTIGDLLSFVSSFRKACQENHLRCLTILEDGGDNNKQIQLQTATYRCFKTNQDAIQHAFATSSILAEKFKFQICRTRVEAMAHSKFAPKTCSDLKPKHASCYFEFHRRASMWKSSYESIQMVVKRHFSDVMQCHVSKVGPKVFVNARFFDVGYEEADQMWNQMEKDLAIETDLVWVKKRLDEYAIYDDNIHMDSDSDSKTSCCEELFNLFNDYLK